MAYPKAHKSLRLTFGSFRTLGVLNVASTDDLGVVVVKALGNVLPICLGEKVERTLDLAAKGRRPTRREAMLNVHGEGGSSSRDGVNGVLQRRCHVQGEAVLDLYVSV